MSEKTGIAWCDSTVNFWWGCQEVSPGCDHCYAEQIAARFSAGAFKGFAKRRSNGEPQWTGKVALVEYEEMKL